jgi:hypothetical protein
MNFTLLRCTAAVFGAVALAGCGGAAVPHAELADAKAAISAADATGARQVPEASLHVEMARDEADRAAGLIADGENEKARDAAQRASADAELATAITNEAKSRNQANAAVQRVEKLERSTTTF